MMNISSLRKEELVINQLRSLYEQYGYAQFKMSKFEEYDLYVRNKDFLISDSIITFTDTNGKLLALKPDVTLSIIKNYRAGEGVLDKVYYNENVYRISNGTHSFKEILQLGVECMGPVDEYSVYEVLSLAAKSLSVFSDDVVLDLSDFGLLTQLLDVFGIKDTLRKKVLLAIAEKNVHDLDRICTDAHILSDNIDALKQLVQIYGAPADVFPKVRGILGGKVDEKSLDSFEALCKNLCDSGFEDMIRIDFSIVNGVDYYNGIVFKGFVKGIPSAVLSGGRYDSLMKKMNRNAGAIGFAVYLDLMEDLLIEKREYDVDSVVVYGENVRFSEVDLVLRKLISEGKNVVAQRNVPARLKYKELWKLTESGVELLERNA